MSEEQKTAVGFAIGMVKVFIRLPIWYYLLYMILKAIEADKLTWFLFWVYVPIGLFVSGIGIVLALLFAGGTNEQPNDS